MTTIRFIFLFLLIALYSCGQKQKHTENPKVIRLTTQVISLTNQLDNRDSCKLGLLYLDSATAIDKNCFTCYFEKLMFLSSLNQYDKVFSTLDTCIKIIPTDHYLYLTAGILHERFGDSISSKIYFKKSLAICNGVLDTMKATNRDYLMFVTDKAINMIMLGDSAKANNILQTLYDNQPDDSAFDNVDKKFILSFMHKSKTEILQAKPDTTESVSYPEK